MRLIVTTMKDEGPFLLEWVAYHLSIGFDHFIICTNDCSDGTDQIAERLQELGLVSHIKNPGPWEKGPQSGAYDKAMAHPKLAEADWIFVCDADEFLNIKVGDGTLDALFQAAPEANMFSFNWQLFGHGGVVDFNDQFVTEQFTRSAHPYQQWPATCRAFKTLYRGDVPFSQLSTHRPKKLDKGQFKKLKWVDGDGDDMTKPFAYLGWNGDNVGVGFGNDLARINHYAVRSLQSFLMKRIRGDVNTTTFHKKMEASGAEYWRLHCWNNVEDLSIQRFSGRVRIKFNELISDPELKELHATAYQYHKTKIDEVIRTDAAQAFMDRYSAYETPETWLIGEDGVICPTLKFVRQNNSRKAFNLESYSRQLLSMRQAHVHHYRKHNRLPWFANLDSLGVRFSAQGQSPEAAPENLRPISESDLKDIPSKGFQDRPKRQQMRKRAIQSIGKRNKTWALLNAENPQVAKEILELKKPEKLYVISPWGYKSTHHSIAINRRNPDASLIAEDVAFLEYVALFSNEIESGQLSLIRGIPRNVMKVFPKHSLDVAFLSGAMADPATEAAFRKVLTRVSPGGNLILDSYHRRGSHGDANLRNLHRILGEHPSTLRFQTIEGAHCVLNVLSEEP